MKVITTIYIDSLLLQVCKEQKVNISQICTQALKLATEENESPEILLLKKQIEVKEADIEKLEYQIIEAKNKIKLTREIIDYLKDKIIDLALYVKRYHEGDDDVKEFVFNDLKTIDPYLKYTKSQIFEALNHLNVVPTVSPKK